VREPLLWGVRESRNAAIGTRPVTAPDPGGVVAEIAAYSQTPLSQALARRRAPELKNRQCDKAVNRTTAAHSKFPHKKTA